MISNFIKYFFFLIISLVSVFSSLFAQDSTLSKKEEAIYRGGCQKSWTKDILPDYSVELISFISIDVIKEDEQPKIIGGEDSLLAKIIYPELARRAGVEGIAIIEVIIDTTGYASQLTIVQGLGAGCEEAIMDALLKQKFNPAKKNGTSINIKMKLTVKFVLLYKINSLDFFLQSIFINKDHLQSRTRFSIYPPPKVKLSDSTNTTGN